MQGKINQQRLAGQSVEVVHLSAHTGEGVDELTQAVTRRLDELSRVVDVFTTPGQGRVVALVRGAGAVIEEDVAEDGSMRQRLRLSPGAFGVLKRQVGDAAEIRPV